MWKTMVVVAIDVMLMAAKNAAQLNTRHEPAAALRVSFRRESDLSGK